MNSLSIKKAGTMSLKKRLKKHWVLYVIIFPILVAYFMFCYVPLITGGVMSFQNYRVGKSIFELEFNHFANYKLIFTDVEILRTIRNTILISLLKLGFGFFPPILLAILLFDLQQKLLKQVSQTLLYIPYFFSWVIVYGIFFALFSNESGLINVALEKIIGRKIEFFTTNGWFLFLLVFSSIWKGMGYGSILYLAGLTSIGPELYEAAKIDGCGPYKRVWYITLPSLMPIITFVLTLNIASILGSDFEQILMFYNTSVYAYGDVLSTWVYRSLSSLKQYNAGIAIGILNGVISLILMVGANFVAKKISGRGIW